MRAAISALRDELAEIECTVDGLQELASAERWLIREQLAAALGARLKGEHVEDAAPSAPEFDQAAQAVTDIAADDDDNPFGF
jgi:hypothetical protein